MQLKYITGRMILDSRGLPTVECDIMLTDGSFGRASVPSGASTGSKEALELRDGGRSFAGKNVSKAVHNINHTISNQVKGQQFDDFASFDHMLIELDGTKNKSKLGANATLAASLAFAKAKAASLNKPLYGLFDAEPALPKAMFNIINGGAHADNGLDVQEFMIMPQFDDFAANLQAACEITYALKAILKQNGLATNVGDEGGFAPDLKSDNEALDLIGTATSQAGYNFGDNILVCLDVAATELVHNGAYYFKGRNQYYTSAELAEYYAQLCQQYPICSIEDGMAEDDYSGWHLLTQKLGDDIQLVGDDLFVTNPQIFKELTAKMLGNAILVKPNQIGTLTETIAVIHAAKTKGYGTIISHRSGETEDTTIAHIAVGTSSGQIKTGAPVRTDRNAKYNELIRIAEVV